MTLAQHHASRSSAEILIEQLPSLARELIRAHAPGDVDFLNDPDSTTEHNPEYHQYGIITHTAKVLEAYRLEAPEYLERSGLTAPLEAYMHQHIGNRSKAELFEASIPLHDLGKFQRAIHYEDLVRKIDHTGHEALSEQIVRGSETVQTVLWRLGHSDHQSDYIARLTGLHFELGIARETAKQSPLGFSLAYLESDLATQAFQELYERFPDYSVEIGLYFLVDSLGKTEFRITASSDAEIEAQQEALLATLQERNLPNTLSAAALQLPVNVACALGYLSFALARA